MTSTYSGTFTHNVTTGVVTYVEFSMNGGTISNGGSTIDLADIESTSTGSVVIQDAYATLGTTAGGSLTYDSTSLFSPVGGSTFDLSPLVAAGITTVNYNVSISGVTGGSTTVLTGVLTQVNAGEYTDSIVADPAIKAVVPGFAATFSSGTNILTSVKIPYTNVVEFYDSSNVLGNTYAADGVVPLTVIGSSEGGGATLNIPMLYTDSVGWGLSGATFDATSLGNPLSFVVGMNADSGLVYKFVDGEQYTISMEEGVDTISMEEGVDPPVEPATAPTISLNYLFTPTAGQTYTYSILGEVSAEIASTETIVLDVPKSKMDTILAYSSNWFDGLSGASGTQPIPDLALILNTVTGSWFDALTMGLTGATKGTSYAYSTALGYVQGDQSSNCHSLDYQFQSIGGFTYTTPGVTGESDVLASIPEEAIKSFTSTEVTTAALSGVVGDSIVIPTEGQIEEYAGLSGAIQSLFEQAVSAGLVTSTAKGATLNSTVVTGVSGSPTLETAMGTTADVYGAQWSVGQSLGIYVQFQMQKLRRYQLATLPSFGGATANQALEISFGGVTFSVDPTVVETSGATPVTYEIILNTIA